MLLYASTLDAAGFSRSLTSLSTIDSFDYEMRYILIGSFLIYDYDSNEASQSAGRMYAAKAAIT